MAVRRNSFYNDPAIGAAFDNLANSFKVPSGSDVYGYTKAGTERAKEARLAEMFAYAKDPNYNREYADRLGVMGGLFNPNQSYYSVDQSNATSRANNAADNKRALTVAELQDKGNTTRTLLGPVSAGATRFVPPSIAQQYAIPETQVGAIEMKPGETTTTPDGRVFQGQQKPLTETEWKAAEAAKLRANGGISDDSMAAIIFGNTPLEVTQTPDGPRNTTRPAAIGKAPVLDDAKTAKPTVANYKTPDGKTGTARVDSATQAWVDTQTGEKLPPGSQTYSANLQGSSKDTGLGPTTANNTAANSRAAELTRTLDTLDLYEGLIRNRPGVVGIPGLIRGTAQDSVAVLKDLANSFGKTVPQLQAATAELQNGLRGVAPEFFDPGIPEANFYQGTLAYALARTENPSGEVSRQAFERAYERIKGGVLSNPDQILAGIGAFRKQLETERAAIGTLRDPSTARTDTSYRGPGTPAAAAPGTPVVEDWVRGPDGKLQRVR